MSVQTYAVQMAKRAKRASVTMAVAPAEIKNKALKRAAKEILKNTSRIIRANKKDLLFARQVGLSRAMMDRLVLDEKRIQAIADSILAVSRLGDPIGRILEVRKRPNGLVIQKVAVPLGVIVIIYESRPNVTSECASLCIKSGNSVILRGGREAYHTNQAIASLFRQALKACRLPQDAVVFIDQVDRKVIDELIQLEELVNLVIPRGGEELIRRVTQHARVPVIKHYKGICHIYVDASADLRTAENVVVNAKIQRPGVCNAMETLLVNKKIAEKFLPKIGRVLQSQGCELRGDSQTRKQIPNIQKATEEDWKKEYLDLILSIRVVEDVHQAIEHIRKYGSAHTDAIMAQNKKTAEEFVKNVDSSSVMVNTSTRFADGNQYGLGAEIGISTDKVHARGPMGIEGLTSYKYVVRGSGQIRA